MLESLNYDIYFLGEDHKDFDWECKDIVLKLNKEIYYISRKHIFSSTNVKTRIFNNCVTIEKFLIWCNYNDESEQLKKAIPAAYEIKGSDKDDYKAYGMIEFAKGNINCLISKPSICGFGMNWQVCHSIIFCGLSDSFEQFYQAVRRCYRFGQTEQVNVYIVISEKELSILDNIKDKEEKHQRMTTHMINLVSERLKEDLQIERHVEKEEKYTEIVKLPKFLIK